MSKTYQQVLKQIDSLKAEAERLRKQEAEGVITRIREAIAHYGLSAADLGTAAGPDAAGLDRKSQRDHQRGSRFRDELARGRRSATRSMAAGQLQGTFRRTIFRDRRWE